MVILWKTLFSTGYTHSRSPQEILNVSATGIHILWVLSCGEQHHILWRTYYPVLWGTYYGYTVENIIVIFCSPHGTHILWVLSCGEQHDILWRSPCGCYPVDDTMNILWRTQGRITHRKTPHNMSSIIVVHGMSPTVVLHSMSPTIVFHSMSPTMVLHSMSSTVVLHSCTPQHVNS